MDNLESENDALRQRHLHRELSNWLDARQSSLKIVKTTTTPLGQTLDWIPFDSQHSVGKSAPAISASHKPMRSAKRPDGVKAAAFELYDSGVERGPEGTVPIVRPNLLTLKRTVALKDYANKRGGLLVNKDRLSKTPVDPDPLGYFHAVESAWTTAYGCDGVLNVWSPSVNNPAGQGDDHSIMQTWLLNYDKQTADGKAIAQSVEMGWTVDPGLNNGSTAPHLFTYYTTNGYAQDGDYEGGYNQLNKGWIQVSSTIFPGAAINGWSVQGGQQVEMSFKIQLNQGNWVVSVDGEVVGYYPASLFNGGLGNNATWVSFGGEVYSSLPDPSQTQDQMGSGLRPEGNLSAGQAAYQRNLRVQSDSIGTMVNSNGTPSTDTANGGANPYNIQAWMNSGTSWQSYFWVGGPTPPSSGSSSTPG